MKACAERGIVVSGTGGFGNPTTGITFGLILELTRRIGWEHARMKSGVLWQNTLGMDIEGKTLGILGLGKLGTKVASIAKAFSMTVIAWSQNLAEEKARAGGATLVSKEDLFRQSDYITIHTQLSDRTRGIVGAKELGLMRPTAYLINTSRGPIVDEAALIEALRAKRIGGAGLDVYDTEPLPVGHPLRGLDNAVIAPHLGYVTADNYSRVYPQMVEDIRGWLDGAPVRVMTR
jgi:D-3-phosphoglycerate dehydrogenase